MATTKAAKVATPEVATIPAPADFIMVRVPRVINVPLPNEAGFVTVEMDKCGDGIAARAVFHGAKQKFADASAGKDDDRASVKERAGLIRDRWYEGEFNLPGGRGARDAIETETWRLVANAARDAGLDPKGITKLSIPMVTARILAATCKAKSVAWNERDFLRMVAFHAAGYVTTAKENVAKIMVPTMSLDLSVLDSVG